MVYLRVYCNGEKIRSMGHSMCEVRYEMALYNGENFSSNRNATNWLKNQIPRNQLVDIQPSKSFHFSYELVKVRKNKTRAIIESGNFSKVLQLTYFRGNEYTISLISQEESGRKFLYSGLITVVN